MQCWNVHGVFYNLEGDRYCKLHHDNEFIEHTRKYLIFGLVETHHTADDIPLIQIPEYRCFQVCRKKLKRVVKVEEYVCMSITLLVEV